MKALTRQKAGAERQGQENGAWKTGAGKREQKAGAITGENVPDPEIEDGRDVIIKAASCAICGSDRHLPGGFMPVMRMRGRPGP